MQNICTHGWVFVDLHNTKNLKKMKKDDSKEQNQNGEMAVNTLCRGNYVCRAVTTLEDLQLLFFALTGNKLEFKDECITCG